MSCIYNSKNCSAEEKEEANPSNGFEYKIDDVPPWHVSLILGFQTYLMTLGGIISYVYMVSPHLCMSEDDPARGYLVSTNFFVSGISTFLQATFGVRLPLVEGSALAFLIPIMAVMHLPEWKCPMHSNSTLTYADSEEIWMPRMREVQGAIITASVFEAIIGLTGIIGFLLNWITPLAIVPTITLVGLSFFTEAADTSSGHWGIAIFTIILTILLSQILSEVKVPLPTYSEKAGWSLDKSPIFKLLAVLLTILISWALCAVLTATDVFPVGNPARADSKLALLRDSPWIRVPYPGQWGTPTFSFGAFVGVLAATVASMIKFIGDMYACAQMSAADDLPKHAINRGIFMEGVGSIICGLFGTASGMTLYSQVTGSMAITKVASRRVYQYGSLFMIVFGMLGKFGAVFVTIPEPILGGIVCIMCAMIAAVGLSALQFVDLNSSRNLFVLGFSLFMGLCLPKWLKVNPGVIKTGSDMLDQVLTILFSTNMLVGGLIGFLLDNILPGTEEERGVLKWRKKSTKTGNAQQSKSYDIPFFSEFFRRHPIFEFLPISNTYTEGRLQEKIISLRRHPKEGTVR